jgi:hypothetical protein
MSVHPTTTTEEIEIFDSIKAFDNHATWALDYTYNKKHK